MTKIPEKLLYKIMCFEDGDMTEKQTISFFQELVNSGLAWKLQGCYGRYARAMLEEGLISLPQDQE